MKLAANLVGALALACQSPPVRQPQTPPTPAAAPEPVAAPAVEQVAEFRLIQAALYQPDSVLQQRVPSVEALGDYFKKLEAAAAKALARPLPPERLDIVVAIRPSGACKVWFVSSSRGDDDAQLGSLRAELEGIKPPAVLAGPVAMALMTSVGGAPPGDVSAPPVPTAWRLAASKRADPVAFDDVLADAWPEPPK